MKKIITFLGERGAMATTYGFAGKDYTGGVFAEALRQFCPFDQMLVCVTEKAAQKTWPVLAALGDERIKHIPIRTGETTAEMWETFKVVTGQVNEGDAVTFDITHGLRSLPFLVFLFAAYLKAAKAVTIDAVYYGALELGDRANGIPAPVIDLSEFTSMLDWITATDRFIQTGAGDALSDLLLERRPSGAAMRDDLHQRDVGRRLKDVAGVIDQISQALSITRPLETMRAAAGLGSALAAAQLVLDERVQPFGVLADKVRAAYAPFALADPLSAATLKLNLWIQVDMVAWCIDKRQFVQAATLPREVVLSLVACCRGQTDITDLRLRTDVETAINNLAETAGQIHVPRARHPDSMCHWHRWRTRMTSLLYGANLPACATILPPSACDARLTLRRTLRALLHTCSRTLKSWRRNSLGRVSTNSNMIAWTWRH